MASTKISNLNLWLEHTGQASLHEHCLGVGRALQSKDISPLLPQGVLSNRIVAAFATFKKDTTLERQGEFTLSTLQRAVLAQARDSRKLMIPAYSKERKEEERHIARGIIG